MASQKRLQDLLPHAKRVSEEQFLREHDYAVLLHRESESASAGTDYITSITDLPGTQPEPTVAISDPWLIVFPIQKRPGGAFRDQIGVGRTRNNDIALPYPRISKYHAYFTRSDDGRDYFLADAGSKNGTFLNGARLAPREPVKLEDGANITFAEAQFRFSSAMAFYRIVFRLAQTV